MSMNNLLSGLGDWFKNLSPEAKKAMIEGGFKAGGAFMDARATGQENAAMRQERAATNMADLEGNFRSEAAQGARDVMGQTKMGEIPATYGSLAMRRALFESLAPGTTMGNVGGMQAPEEFRSQMATFGGPSLDGAREQAMKYFSDDALQADLARRLSAEGRVDPNGATFDMTSIWGDGAKEEMDSVNALKGQTNQFIQSSQDRSRQALQQALNGKQQNGQQGGKEKGTPWWKKALKVASVVAPIVAAPFTGGTSLALIGAGSALANRYASGGGSPADYALSGALGSTSGLGARGGARPAMPPTGAAFAQNYASNAPQMASFLNPVRRTGVPNVRFGG